MRIKIVRHVVLAVAVATAVSNAIFAQATNDPFPTPITASEGVITVKFVEFASIPDSGAQAARPMLLVNEAGTRRLFVNDMTGPLYAISYDGKSVSLYLDVNAPEWEIGVQSRGSERGFQSFTFHPQFSQRGTRGYGKFYTYTDTININIPGELRTPGANRTHDTVLLEWTAKNPAAPTYDGGPPRELIRFEQPFSNHNAGHVTFNPLATARDADFGLLYFGCADGGSGGDPMNQAQNLGSAFGKILRIDPLGTDSANGKYGIPKDNPFASDGDPNTLGEIYAYGVRNAQRLFWDPKNRNMFMSDIGQNTVEEVSPVTPGANLGWNIWEGSFTFIPGRPGGVNLTEPRKDPKVTYPIVEYGQLDPLLQPNSAAIGGFVYRHKAIPQLTNLLIFGDNPSGEIFYVNADNLPKGGQDTIRRVLLNDNGETKTFLQVIKEKNAVQGKQPATRADLRFGEGPDGQIFLLNKRDGVIRRLVP
ncbi:MAG: PQQ-dependent sugar dehydrogenase [Acidobacteria bacterium]|nr:PQQ-dependent sugar dehydrogenase [Acidobacteriota bacterium]